MFPQEVRVIGSWMVWKSERRWIAAAALALAACGGGEAGSADAGTPDAPSAADASPFPSPLAVPYYEVPVEDPALAPYAFFGVPDVHVVVAGGQVTLTYDFPPDLSGVEDQTVTLTGPVGPTAGREIEGTVLSDAVGTGTCTVAAGIARCTEIFSALPLDHAAAVATVEAAATTPAERAGRRAVVDAFVADPIGIVVFDLAEALEPSGGDDDD